MPRILPTFISFFQCVYATPNQIVGFRARDERRTLLAQSVFDIVRITSSIVWMRILCIYFHRTATIDI